MSKTGVKRAKSTSFGIGEAAAEAAEKYLLTGLYSVEADGIKVRITPSADADAPTLEDALANIANKNRA